MKAIMSSEARIIHDISNLYFRDGLPISSVMIQMDEDTEMLRAIVSIHLYLPHDELVEQIINIKELRERTKDVSNGGVTVGGVSRHPDIHFLFTGNADTAKRIIQEIANVGEAEDSAKFDADLPTYPHFLTKTNAWGFCRGKRKGKS